MPLNPAEQDALRRRCATLIGGHRESAPGEELVKVGEWCREHGWYPDRYGEGALIGAFEAKIASLLGLPAAVFMPSGTMAQQIALRIAADNAGTPLVAMHPTSHLELHELRAYARLQRLDAVLVGPRERPILARDLKACSERLAALVVELPAREIGGQLPAWDELVELSAQARARGVRLHMDGARLWEAREAYAPRSLAEICELFDSVYVSFYKGIGASSGAMLAGATDFIRDARAWRKRHGGTLWQLHPYVASAAMRFDAQLAKMPAYRARALTLAEHLARVAGIRILPFPPQTNLFHVYWPASVAALTNARDRLAQDDNVWIAGRFSEAQLPGWSYQELYVGDSFMALDDAVVAALFAKLLAAAQASPT
jgi:threonine aldolase